MGPEEELAIQKAQQRLLERRQREGIESDGGSSSPAPNDLQAALGRLEKLALEHEKASPTAVSTPTPPKTEVKSEKVSKPARSEKGRAPRATLVDPDHARYDHAFAEFPAFRLGRHFSDGPIHYEDTIKGPDGAPLSRKWTVRHDAEFGVGTAFTNGLLFSLDQVWKEQGFKSHRIYFGTFSKLHQMRCPGEYPGGRDIGRLRRHLDILCGYKIDCENSFFDASTKTYGTLRGWSLFTGWYEPKRKRGASPYQEELPLCWIEVSDTFLTIARERGFFATGFDTPFFFSLSDSEQRLALYLSKMFASQTFHQRRVDTLVSALPSDAKDPKKQRQLIRNAANGLLGKKWPYLRAFEITKGSGGDWVARFQATRKIPQNHPLPKPSLTDIPDAHRLLVEDIVEEFHDHGSERLWAKMIQLVGEDAVRFEFSDLRSLIRENRLSPGSNPAKLLNVRLQKRAKERGVEFQHHKPKSTSVSA